LTFAYQDNFKKLVEAAYVFFVENLGAMGEEAEVYRSVQEE